VIAIRRCLVFLGSDDLDTILTHQTTYTPVPDIQPQLLQLFGHTGAAIALQTKTVLLTDMDQKYHIIPLALAHGTYPPSPEPARCDLHNATEKLYGPNFFPGIDESKPHPLPGSACLHAREGVLACKEDGGLF
jgi:hypothetical protein